MPLIDDLSDATWLMHDGGTNGIGGVANISRSLTPIPGENAMVLSVEGNASPNASSPTYPATMWYAERGVNGKNGVTLEFEMAVSDSAVEAANVVESDVMMAAVCADGKTRLFNMSAQYKSGTGWMVVDATGKWVATGLNPNLGVSVKYDIEIHWTFDLVKNMRTFQGVTVAGLFDEPPATFVSTIPATIPDPPWATTANVQFQLGSLPNGLPWSERIGKVKLRWS